MIRNGMGLGFDFLVGIERIHCLMFNSWLLHLHG